MHVSDILASKGRPTVITIGPDDTIEVAAQLLHNKHIGALIVCADDGAVAGVLSERDVARSIALKGSAALAMAVRNFMTAEVVTCGMTDTTANIMKTMSKKRFRHMPVIEDGELKGMISIGDAVKHRLDEFEQEASALKEYVLAGH